MIASPAKSVIEPHDADRHAPLENSFADAHQEQRGDNDPRGTKSQRPNNQIGRAHV